ncbi:MAG: hypothetical protein C0608_07115 [Deltaproteobacteria bacterium]|nr:MAG: hypothetical protein C0608_07115 [Deltaproteobacteria bacterium]
MADQTKELGGGFSFFAAWMLLHEKADDWLRDALRRANEAPEESRRDYQRFLIGVDREKEALKGIFSEAITCELKHLGFIHESDEEKLSEEVSELRERIRALETKLERIKGDR